MYLDRQVDTNCHNTNVCPSLFCQLTMAKNRQQQRQEQLYYHPRLHQLVHRSNIHCHRLLTPKFNQSTNQSTMAFQPLTYRGQYPPFTPRSPSDISSFTQLHTSLRALPELAREGEKILNEEMLAKLVDGMNRFQHDHLGRVSKKLSYVLIFITYHNNIISCSHNIITCSCPTN